MPFGDGTGPDGRGGCLTDNGFRRGYGRGMGRGFARGAGRGRGFGRGLGMARGNGYGYRNFAPNAAPAYYNKETELNILKEESKYLKEDLAEINKRIDELSSENNSE